MSPARSLCIVACLSAGFLLSSAACGQIPPVQDRITEYEQKLAAARTAHQVRDVGQDLIVLGYLYRQAGEMQKALADLNEALPIEQTTNNRPGQALAMNTMGKIYSDTGDENKALDFFRQAWAIWDQLGVEPAEALVLNNIARTYYNLGQRDQAINYLNESLQLWGSLDKPGESKRMIGARQRMHDIGQWKALKEWNDEVPPEVKEQLGRDGEASTFDMMGQTYTAMGRGSEALDFFNRALPLWKETGQQGGEALTLNNMGRAYADLGQKQNALDSLNRALEVWKTVGNRQGEALTLDNIGRLYRDLGLQQSALDYYNQAFSMFRESGTKPGEGLALNDIGRAYADMGQPQKAIEYSQQALQFWRDSSNPRGEAMTLNNMGRDYFNLGDAAKSLDYDTQALVLWRKVKDRRGEALALMTIGWAQYALKQWDKALVNELVALALAKEADDPVIEGGIETALMIGFRDQHHLEEAIFFGMEAVSAYQTVRQNISEMDKDLQAGFAQSKSMTYRILAELLVETGRLGEAEQILDLLKEQELKDVVRDTAPDRAPKLASLSLTPVQERAQSAMVALKDPALTFEQQSEEAAALEEKTALTPAEDARLKVLTADLDQGNLVVLSGFASGLYRVLEQPAVAAGTAPGAAAQSYLQDTLVKLGPRVLAIRILLGDDHAYEIVVTADTRRKIELPASSADLRTKALETLRILAQRDADPRPQLAQLYAMIVAPLEADLKALETSPGAANTAPTLLWSLDDALRYLPMAALYDGRHYLLERFNNVLFTPESYGHLTDVPLASAPSVLAMGLSISYGGLPALPGVLPELESIVRDPTVPQSHGPMAGKLLRDDQFTLAAVKTELGEGNGFSVVHIASHFVVETGGGGEPYLMLGGEKAGTEQGFAWPLSDLENSPVAFRGTRLLTLSACSTAKDYTSRNGIEMDSLGMVAQQKDAEAVLATLWDVNDASTSRLMSDFYARWLKNPETGKGEALRQAQLALFRSQPASDNAHGRRGFETESGNESAPGQAAAANENSPSLGYSHPYYWAPFVLIGNFK
ncbi:MAG: CHAT domain-containing protein [Terracidiphilus sp.]